MHILEKNEKVGEEKEDENIYTSLWVYEEVWHSKELNLVRGSMIICVFTNIHCKYGIQYGCLNLNINLYIVFTWMIFFSW